MNDPVLLGITGHTYERIAIEIWLQNHNTDPLTNLFLENKTLTPNRKLLAFIEEFLEYNLQSFKEIGRGAYKIVFRGLFRDNLIPVAICKVSSIQLTLQEAKTFVKLGFHPHLTRYYGRACLNEQIKSSTVNSKQR